MVTLHANNIELTDYDGNPITIELINSEYNGAALDLTLSQEPVFKYDVDGEGLFAPIRRTSCELTFATYNIDELLQILNENLTCEITIDGYYTYFGYFFGDGIEYSETNELKHVKVVFVDLLGRLKNKKFEEMFTYLPHVFDITKGGNSRWGFRYHVTQHILTNICKFGLTGVRIFDSDSVFDKDGVMLHGFYDETNYSDNNMLAGAYIDVDRLMGKTYYDILKELCETLGYYAIITNKVLNLVHLNTIFDNESIAYTSLSFNGTTLAYSYSSTTTLSPFFISTVEESSILTEGIKNVKVKSDYGLRIDKYITFDKILQSSKNTAFRVKCLIGENTGLMTFGSSNKFAVALNDNDVNIQTWGGAQLSHLNWMNEYVKIPFSIAADPLNKVKIKISVKLGIADSNYNRYVSAFLNYDENFNEGGIGNSCIGEGEWDWLRLDGDLFVRYQKSVSINTEEVTFSFEFASIINSFYGFHGLHLMIGPAYLDTAQKYYSITTIKEVTFEIKAINGLVFDSGEEVSVINKETLSALVEKKIGYGSCCINLDNTETPTPIHFYKGSIAYGNYTGMYPAQFFGDDLQKYKLNEYIGRQIARQSSNIGYENTITAREMLTNSIDTSGIFALFNSLYVYGGRLLMPLGGTYTPVSHNGKIKAHSIYKSIRLITEDSAFDIITEDGINIITEKYM